VFFDDTAEEREEESKRSLESCCCSDDDEYLTGQYQTRGLLIQKKIRAVMHNEALPSKHVNNSSKFMREDDEERSQVVRTSDSFVATSFN
jgi:hypothetical protein